MNRPKTSEGTEMNVQARRSKVAVIVLCWALINIYFYWHNVIVTTGEAGKYIDQARIFVATGHLSSPNFWLYFIPICLIAFCIKFHLSFGWMYALQLGLNLS